jgi:hypothetical protein
MQEPIQARSIAKGRVGGCGCGSKRKSAMNRENAELSLDVMQTEDEQTGNDQTENKQTENKQTEKRAVNKTERKTLAKRKRTKR